jgi:hypothetical protein
LKHKEQKSWRVGGRSNKYPMDGRKFVQLCLLFATDSNIFIQRTGGTILTLSNFLRQFGICFS